MEKKTCFVCGGEKPLNEFHRHKRMRDGRLNKCKECVRAYVRQHYKENPEYYSEYERKRANLPHRIEARKRYAQTPAGKAAHKRARQKHKRLNPIKHGAATIVGNAVRDGKLIRPRRCESCDALAKLHGHHDDYAQPLVVRWLCITCHTAWHKENGEGLNG